MCAVRGCSFAALKPGAIVLNVSRGGLIDTDAAIDALEAGQLGGLAMDVYDREGPTHRLICFWSLSNTLCWEQ